MHNNPALEASFVTTYVEDYMDFVESMPNRVQPSVSRIKQLDLEYQNIMSELTRTQQMLIVTDERDRRHTLVRVQQLLRQAQLNGDSKLRLVAQINEIVEQKKEQLDHDLHSFGAGGNEQCAAAANTEGTGRPSRASVYGKGRYPRAFGINSAKNEETVASEGDQRRTPAKSNNNNASNSASPSTSHKRAAPFVRVARKLTCRRSRVVRTTMTAINRKALTPSSKCSTPTHVLEGEIKERQSESPSPRASSRTTNNQTPRPSSTVTPAAAKPRRSTAAVTRTNKKRAKVPAAGTKSNTRASAKDQDEEEMPDLNEATFCLCSQPSYGEMVGCDNDHCAIEWFHFVCVSLTAIPKGKWYCPGCRGDKSSSIKPSLANK